MTRPPDYQRDRSDRQIARILCAVTAQPMTARQLATKISLTVSAVLLYTKRLRAERKVYVSAYVQPANGKGRAAPMYAAGGLQDFEYTPSRKPKQGGRLELQRDRVLKAMELPCTSDQLAEKLFLTQSRARFYIRELRLAKLVYIESWVYPLGRGDHSPVYALGSKRDKKKPQQQTRAARYRIEKADEEKHDRLLAKRRARHHITKAVRVPQSWLSALGV